MSVTLTELKDSISAVRNNPAAIQRLSLSALESVSNGELNVVDPSNPFVFLLEASATNASATMVEAETLTRQLYPSMALTEEELYLHMSDKDYIGRFSSPARATFTLLFNKDELKAKAVATELAGVSKLTIPRNTEFRISDYVFTLEYPIELRVLSHGGIQVMYDTSRPSPLETIENNVVDWNIVKISGLDYVKIRVPVNQFKVTSVYAQLSLSATYSKTFNLEDQYYYCRVYRKLPDGTLSEVKTTHTEQVFDPLTPTVLLKAYQNKLTVTVPQVYVLQKKFEGDVRIDIYTTKGPLDLQLTSYELGSFTADWRDLDLKGGVDEYTLPITTFSNMAVYSDDTVRGGTDGLSFEELRERVINNALGDNNNPITANQVSATISNLGYKLITGVDNVTNRIFLAGRDLPKNIGGNSSSGIGCLYGTLQATFEDLISNSAVIDNGDRITLTNNVLYKEDNEIIKVVDDVERDSLKTLVGEELLNEINGNNYLLSPFHAVLDGEGNYFDARFYYLENPTVVSREFVQENNTLPVYVSTDSYSISKTDTGYKLRVKTISGDTVKTMDAAGVTCQLSFKPVGERNMVYMNGTFISFEDGERIFEFDLGSRFDIDKDDNLYLSGFDMFPNEDRKFAIALKNEFNLVYYVKDLALDPSINFNELNFSRAEFLLPGDYKGVSHEAVVLKLGTSAEGLWTNSRTVLTGNEYERYAEDVLAYYTENVYERDPTTGTVVVSIDPTTGAVVYNLLHAKGDPVLDVDGNQVIKFTAGTIKLDANGDKILIDGRKLLREVDIFLIDARYMFATDTKDVTYFKSVPATIINWLDEDIQRFSKWTLEQTKFYLYPTKSLGSGKVAIYDNEIRNMPLQQSFKVIYYLSNNGYNDFYLRNVLKDLAVDTIAGELTKKRVTTNNIISKLTAVSGDEVLAIDVEGLGGDMNLPALTLIEDADRCSIRKRLTKGLDGFFRVEDDIEIVYVRHEE